MHLPQLDRILRERGSSGSRLMTELGYSKQLWPQNQAKGWPQPAALRVAEHLGVSLATLTTAGVPTTAVGPDVRALLEHIEVARPYQELQTIIDTAIDRAVREIAVAVAGLVAAGTVDARAVVSQHRAALPATPGDHPTPAELQAAVEEYEREQSQPAAASRRTKGASARRG